MRAQSQARKRIVYFLTVFIITGFASRSITHTAKDYLFIHLFVCLFVCLYVCLFLFYRYATQFVVHGVRSHRDKTWDQD